MVTLEITDLEATVLYDLLMNVGGSPVDSPRKDAGTLLFKLQAALREDPRPGGHPLKKEADHDGTLWYASTSPKSEPLEQPVATPEPGA